MYFQCREEVLRAHDECGGLPEASLVGGFSGNESKPCFDSYRRLHRVIDDEHTWNLIPLLDSLRDHQSHEDYGDDYYLILEQFMRLPRSMWREVRRRISLAVEKVSSDEFTLPYRVTDPVRDVGFVILPMDSGFTSRTDWNEMKVQALINMTELHKFDHKLTRGIGVLVAKDGDMFDIQWCMSESEWEDNPELSAKLDVDSPFRATSGKTLHGFFTVDE